MKSIKKTSDLVKEILIEEPKARNSDMYLYYMVCLKTDASILGKPFSQVIMNLKSLNLPPFESVGRARRKIQRAYPELAGSDVVEGYRLVNEEAFRSYARGIV